MSVTTKPTMRSVREQIDAAIEGRNLENVPGLPDRLDAYAAMVARIDSPASPNKRSEIDRLVGEAEAAYYADREQIVDAAIRSATSDLDSEEGQLRAHAGTAPEMDAGVTARAALLVAQVNAASDAPSVERVFDDAQFTGHVELGRIVGTAVLARLRDLAIASSAASTTSPARVAHSVFIERFKKFEREHPTPRQRVEAIARERSNRATSIRQAAEFMTRMYGVGRAPTALPAWQPVPPGHSSRMIEGPAFDLLNAGRIRR